MKQKTKYFILSICLIISSVLLYANERNSKKEHKLYLFPKGGYLKMMPEINDNSIYYFFKKHSSATFASYYMNDQFFFTASLYAHYKGRFNPKKYIGKHFGYLNNLEISKNYMMVSLFNSGIYFPLISTGNLKNEFDFNLSYQYHLTYSTNIKKTSYLFSRNLWLSHDGLRWTGVGKHLKSKSGWEDNGNGTDDFGFNGKPAGYSNTAFWFKGYHTHFWTSTVYDPDEARYRHLPATTTELRRNQDTRYTGKSIRCLKD